MKLSETACISTSFDRNTQIKAKTLTEGGAMDHNMVTCPAPLFATSVIQLLVLLYDITTIIIIIIIYSCVQG